MTISGKKIATLILCCQVFGARVEGRYIEGDDLLIDQEDAMNREYYNDESSYRYPRSWVERWQQSMVGVRANAGSLNSNRFLYHHDIKAMTDPDASAFLAYTQAWRDDVVEERHLQELLAGAEVFSGWRLGVSAYSGTWKKYGDMGVLIGWWDKWTETAATVQLVSTDHYFNTKEEDSRDRYETKPFSYIFDLRMPLLRWQTAAHVEWDHPLVLRKGSGAYTYRNFIRSGEVTAQSRSDEWRVRLLGRRQQKEESKTWDGGQEKALVRAITQLESAVDYDVTPVETLTGGLAAVERQGSYDYSPQNYSQLTPPEPVTPNVLKSEQMVFVTRHAPLFQFPKIYAQNGLFLNKVRINEGGTIEHFIEAKYGFNVEWHVAETSMVAMTTTWDLDQLYMDFPYDPYFRPWGGGGFQFQMTF